MLRARVNGASFPFMAEFNHDGEGGIYRDALRLLFILVRGSEPFSDENFPNDIGKRYRWPLARGVDSQASIELLDCSVISTGLADLSFSG
jgi:hypothetical protein